MTKYLYTFFLTSLSLLFGNVSNPLIQRADFLPVTVEIDIRNDNASEKGEVVSATFNGQQLTLTPPIPTGERGVFYFRVSPGVYPLEWKVANNSFSWPRTTTFQKKVKISQKEDWVTLLIVGQEYFQSSTQRNP